MDTIKNSAEIEYAAMLDSVGKKYIYHPAAICSDRFPGKTKKYYPDFYLPDENAYIEVINTRQAYFANKEKYAVVFDLGYNFNIVDKHGNPYRGAILGTNKYININKSAREKGVARGAVYYALASGKINGETIAGTVMVVRDAAFEAWRPKTKLKKH
jgi:hypothetical protein